MGVLFPFPSWPAALIPKHSTVCDTSSAQVKSLPVATTFAEDENVTDNGVEDSVVPLGLAPNWPDELDPKHHARVPTTTHECAKPAAADVAVPPPNAATRLGVKLSETEELPSRPLVNAPQHHVSPVVLVAHACTAPTSRDSTVNEDGMDTTAVGVELPTVLVWFPFPSCPRWCRPQHITLFVDNTAHVVLPPAATRIALVGSVTWTGSA